MALKLYHDSAGSKGDEITGINPDEVKEAVESGSNLVSEAVLWLESSDGTLTYENIEITKDSNSLSPAVTLEYAPDSGGSAGTYVSTYEPADGAYGTAHKFWRRVTVNNVTEAFKREDINHQVKADEYIA